MRIGAHIVTVAALLVAFLVVPAWWAGAGADVLLAGDKDLVVSQTTTQEAPSGSFTILINHDRHKDDEAYARWLDFLAGGDVPLIMEDASCFACYGDTAGIEMACSLAARLPAGQMKVRTEDGALVLSKAEVGRFDIIVMSDEVAKSLDASTVADRPFVGVVHR